MALSFCDRKSFCHYYNRSVKFDIIYFVCNSSTGGGGHNSLALGRVVAAKPLRNGAGRSESNGALMCGTTKGPTRTKVRGTPKKVGENYGN